MSSDGYGGEVTTVRWLMAQRRLQLTLRAGAAGLDRTLDCAVSSELIAAADWLSGGEVLLTTGLRLSADAGMQRSYVHALDSVRVAAIGFGVGLGYDEVPGGVIAAADEVGLPVFEVPLPVPFSAITRAVLDQIAAQRSARLVSATRAQPRMTRAAAAAGHGAVVRELAEAVGQQVVLLDVGHVLVSAAPERVTAEHIDQIRTLIMRDPASAGAVWVTPDATVTVARISSGRNTFGHLGLIGPDRLDDVGRMLIGHAVSLLAIEYAKPQQVRRDVAALQGDVLALALDGAPRADGLGTAARTLLLRAADPAERIRAAVFGFHSVAQAQQGAERLAEELERRWRPVFVHRVAEEVIALLRGDDHVQFVAGLLNVLSSNTPVRGGIGGPAPVSDVADSVRQARLGARSATVGQLVDLRAAKSLLVIDPVRQALRDSYSHRLDPVISHDEEHAGHLYESLLAYLEANGNWGVAAAELGVHRHTLRGRMQRVEELLTVDLADARTRAELLLIMLAADE
ncbi:MAG: PucR family transcriptional regulator [Gordonia sp. (in: high G+C Gram-positive bacteria)]